MFSDGREVAEYQGAYKVSHGLLERLGQGGSSTLQSARMDLRGLGVGRQWLVCSNHRIHDVSFSLVGLRQVVNNAPNMLRCRVPIQYPDHIPWPQRTAHQLGATHFARDGTLYANAPG